MSTQMRAQDWEIALAAFRARLPRRGERSRHDRRFLEALHCFSVHNLSWRALPDCFGAWNSLWKRFRRLSRSGVFEGFFETLASLSRSALWCRGSIPPWCARPSRRRGQEGQALGRSRGGFSPKIHLKSDLEGHCLAFVLTGDEKADAPQFLALFDLDPDITPRAARGDKGYDSNANRQVARDRKAVPVIPCKSNARNRPACFPKTLCKGRARNEQSVGKLKRFKRIALCCAKTALDFLSCVRLAAAFLLIKSVHRA